MLNLADHLEEFLTRYGLKDAALGIGFSAGVDSVVLAHSLRRLLGTLGSSIKPTLYYVDHQQREQEEIFQDVQILEFYSEHNGWTARVLRGPKPTGSDEASLRGYRLDLLLQAAQVDGLEAVLLAHHRDDNQEQFYLRSRRYPSPWSSGLIPEHQGIFFRPFLKISKADIQATALEHSLIFHRDSSNSDPRFLRNALRRTHSRILEDSDLPNILSEWGSSSRSYLQEVDVLLGTLLLSDGWRYKVEHSHFQHLDRLLRQRLISLCLNRLAVKGEYSEAQLEEFINQWGGCSQGCFFLEAVVIRWDAEYLFFDPIVVKDRDFGYFIKVKGSFRWREGSFLFSTAPAESAEGFRFAAEGRSYG
jgi:tRNA(Ile)-lysidine synthetase-like protein